jgi:hypothetical protein
VSWVRVPADERARQWRCVVDLGFAPDVLARYASLGTADRLRVRTHVCDLARRAVDEEKPRVEDAEIECRVAVDVTRAELDDALRALTPHPWSAAPSRGRAAAPPRRRPFP